MIYTSPQRCHFGSLLRATFGRCHFGSLLSATFERCHFGSLLSDTFERCHFGSLLSANFERCHFGSLRDIFKKVSFWFTPQWHFWIAHVLTSKQLNWHGKCPKVSSHFYFSPYKKNIIWDAWWTQPVSLTYEMAWVVNPVCKDTIHINISCTYIYQRASQTPGVNMEATDFISEAFFNHHSNLPHSLLATIPIICTINQVCVRE